MTTAGPQTYTATGTITLASTYTVNGVAAQADAIQFAGAVSLADDATIVQNGGEEADDVVFTSTIDGAHSLVITAAGAGDITLGGAVGGTTPLASLAATAEEITLGDVTTAGPQTYTGNVTLGSTYTTTNANGDFTINGATTLGGASSVDTSAGGADVTFNGTLDGANGLVVDAGTGKVTLRDDVGGITPLASLDLNTTGDIELGSALTTTGDIGLGSDLIDPIPQQATIYARGDGDDVEITTGGGHLTVGALHKFTVVDGSLTIDAGNTGNVTLGDVSVRGNFIIQNAASITLLRRPAGQVLQSNGSLAPDSGVDYVAGGTFNFNVAPTAAGAGADPRFASPNPTSQTIGTFLWLAYQDAITKATLTGPANVALDLRAEGRNPTNVVEGIAGAVPKPSEVEAVTQEVALDPALKEQLVQLGIYTRDLTPEELGAFGTRPSAVFDDTVKKPTEIEASDRKVPASRLPNTLLEKAVATYRAIFWENWEEEGKRKYRGDALLSLLKNAFNAAKRAGKTEPAAFREFLEKTPDQAEALALLNNLRVLFSQISALGLTEIQQTESERLLLRDIVPTGMTVDNLREAIRGK